MGVFLEGVPKARATGKRGVGAYDTDTNTRTHTHSCVCVVIIALHCNT